MLNIQLLISKFFDKKIELEYNFYWFLSFLPALFPCTPLKFRENPQLIYNILKKFNKKTKTSSLKTYAKNFKSNNPTLSNNNNYSHLTIPKTDHTRRLIKKNIVFSQMITYIYSIIHRNNYLYQHNIQTVKTTSNTLQYYHAKHYTTNN